MKKKYYNIDTFFIEADGDDQQQQATDYTAEQPPEPDNNTQDTNTQTTTTDTTQQATTTDTNTQTTTTDTTQQTAADTNSQPTDYTAEQPPTATGGTDPNAQPPTTDTTATQPDAATTGQDQTQTTNTTTTTGNGKESEVNKDLAALDKELFKDLDESEIAIKNKKLKMQFLELYNSIINIIDKLDNIKKDVYTTQVMSFVAFKLDDLKNMITDYISEVYDNKTYIENLIYYNQCLAIMSGISQILKEINIDLKNKI